MEAVEVLDALAYHEKQIAYHQAQSLRVLADYAIACEGDEFFDAEIAAAMRWTSRWTSDQIAMALDLASKLPRTLDALEKGDIDLYKARVLHDRTLPLSADLAAEVEERVLSKAPGQTGAQMRQLTNRVVMRVDPEGHKERAEERKKQRCTGIDALEDDMARIWAFLPVHLAAACSARVDSIARQTHTPDDPRTLDQVRADVFADLLLATPDKTSAVKVELYVTVSAATLMGLSEQPGEIAGFGAITADLARELDGDATWDRTCRFPGCMRASRQSDLDHTVPFPLGTTSAANLGAFCRRHHRVKHRTAWQVSQPKPGRFCFRGPAGRTYRREPEPVLGDPPPF